ncbi:MAG: zinc-ribbon domain-containing protein [Candidatus Thorarchaeota archaeon]
MDILATAYIDGHQIVVERSQAWGTIQITYDGSVITKHNTMFLRQYDYEFQVIEDNAYARYLVTLRTKWSGLDVDISKNGLLVFSTRKGFKPPPPKQTKPVTSPQHSEREKDVFVKEVILVVCPHCNHRNDSVRRTCEKCGASI